MQQLSPIDLALHEARMSDIRGNTDEAISKYKSVAQYLMDLQKQYPSQGGYYSQYVNMILEEAEAVRDNRKSANIFTPSTNSFSPSAPQQLQFQPIEQPSTPTSSFTPQPSSSLSYDDFRMAAVGLGQKVHQFDQQYGVSQKCKDAAHTCAVKAKEIDNEYEIRKKAAELGHQIKDWDERNGVSKTVVSGVKQVASSIEGAIK
ncbi:hypothetical protein WA588_002075, partial [Blastocystis sp. NMH]